MRKIVLAGAVAAAILVIGPGGQAEAACRDTNSCALSGNRTKFKPASGNKVPSHTGARKKGNKATTKKIMSRKLAPRGRPRTYKVNAAGGGEVVGLIKAMAPGYGVPTWFALRIAHVESNYNPHARGSAGELGVFQLKCATAKGIGYRGKCSGLLDARTNVQYGLKHLSLAVKSSGGNLKLAASKHNGGLGRKRLVHSYVNKVF